MRLVVDTIIALMLVAILGGVLLYHRQQTQTIERVQAMHRALARLHETALYHGAMGEPTSSATGFPLNISPGWFDGNLPTNALVTPRHPWIDVAPADDGEEHPPDPVCTRPGQAGFWYNPNRGIFRARVPAQLTDVETLEFYNQINNSYLKQLPRGDDPARAPRELTLSAVMPSIASDGVVAVEATLADTPRANPRGTLMGAAPKR